MLQKVKASVKKIIFFDLHRWINSKNLAKKTPSDFKNYLSAALMIKNEAEYLPEWLEYHLLVGVDKFYIYDNDSTDRLKDILRPYIEAGIAEYIYYPKKQSQTYMCNDAIKKVQDETYWLAIIDTDEFIVPKNGLKISEILKNYESYPGVELNWLLYGDSGQTKKTEGLIIERFTHHAKLDEPRNRHVKTISNPRKVAYIPSPHNAVYFNKQRSVNTAKVENKLPFLKRVACFDQMYIAHYFTRSREEYFKRRKQGPATQGANLYGSEEIYRLQNKNDIEDLIMEKYVSIIKTNIALRMDNNK